MHNTLEDEQTSNNHITRTLKDLARRSIECIEGMLLQRVNEAGGTITENCKRVVFWARIETRCQARTSVLW
jgi:hypothetical protein